MSVERVQRQRRDPSAALQDAAEAAAVAQAALEQMYPETECRSRADEAARVAAGTARVAHLQRTDPGGCWVAEVEGQIVGTAIGLIREGVWGFSLFGVLPAFQAHGIGRRLYAPAVAYGESERGGIILSSVHPAALVAMPSHRDIGYCRL